VTTIVTEYAKASSFVSCRHLGLFAVGRARREIESTEGRYYHKDTEIAEFRILKKASEGAMKEINEGIKRRQRNSVVETDVPGFIPRGR
jgi:hypothetical protein